MERYKLIELTRNDATVIARAVLTAVLLVCAQTAYSQEFWNGTRAGMSLDDIKKAYPAVVNENGHIYLYREILSHNSRIEFTIGSNGLYREQILVGDSGEAVVQEVISAISSKYGPQIGCESIIDTLRTCRWVSGQTLITTNEIEVYGLPSIVVDYDVGQKRDNTF